jgi:hypothetical protein
MPKLSLLLLIMASVACQSRPSQAPTRPVEVRPVHPVAFQATSRPIQDGEYAFFLELIRSGIELPHALVKQYTLIAQPYGKFEGVELLPVSESLHLIVLRQADGECIRHFLLTGNGTQTLDQVMIAEQCPSTLSTLPTTYRFRGQNQVDQLEVIATSSAAKTLPQPRVLQTFTWNGNGRISLGHP